MQNKSKALVGNAIITVDKHTNHLKLTMQYVTY